MIPVLIIGVETAILEPSGLSEPSVPRGAMLIAGASEGPTIEVRPGATPSELPITGKTALAEAAATTVRTTIAIFCNETNC